MFSHLAETSAIATALFTSPRPCASQTFYYEMIVESHGSKGLQAAMLALKASSHAYNQNDSPCQAEALGKGQGGGCDRRAGWSPLSLVGVSSSSYQMSRLNADEDSSPGGCHAERNRLTFIKLGHWAGPGGRI